MCILRISPHSNQGVYLGDGANLFVFTGTMTRAGASLTYVGGAGVDTMTQVRHRESISLTDLMC